ncbi:hypothetical protein FGG08_001494 [Glutinoglossum americanum]|uniref:C2H2-type domain-containing protein n=1 Tax=Glutinoglossum americanum TaxID=1670608 RepID=A0A9P8IBF1_9PEZI|nr:hypothetical protein FGG08_001494 [Glutinoglossum americanum]
MKFFHTKDAKETSRKPAQQDVGKSGNTATSQNPNFPPPKTDKPRPHVCGTCSRSFARLEHLKRHERSHTKEKPFECPECTRCFARRDLLLRHQQKLHMSSTPSSRPRAGRRESTSSVGGSGPGRVRKSSVTNSTGGAPGAPSVRPRANTISHVDGATLGMLAAANSSHFNYLPSLAALHGPSGYDFRGVPNALGHHGNFHGLPKLETHGLNVEIGGGLRTAPPYGGIPTGIDIGHISFPPGPTVNPAQLHFSDSPHAHPMMTPSSPFQHAFPGMSASQVLMEDDDNYDWIHGFENQVPFSGQNENAIEGSSPSAISSASQSGISEVMLDGSNNPAQGSGQLWTQNPMMPPATMASNQFSMELSGTAFSEMNPSGTVSPNGNNPDNVFSTPPPMNALSPTPVMPGLSNQFFHPPMVYGPETPSASSASMNGSTRKTSITSVSADSITDATRQTLLLSLSQPPPFAHNHRKFSTSSTSSPLSPAFGSKSGNIGVSLPNTADLQRYVGSYIQYFHPHLPFLHLPTLTFNAPEYTDNLRPSTNHSSFSQSSISGGGGCLILAMAAIGALFEYESAVSLELFESAKKLIHLFLEERRKADISRSSAGTDNSIQNTPLWLVQAMLLNVVYGHNCGDKLKSDIANTHCAALVSLTRAAGLPTGEMPQGLSYSQKTSPLGDHSRSEDIQMGDDGLSSPEIPNEQTEWYNWKAAEERKRTCYAVFILSSLLVSAYNMAPAFASSEVRLDLPCDEDLWTAENPAAWYAKGGSTLAQHNAVPFSGALSSLLSADQRQAYNQQMSRPYHQAFASNVQNGVVPESDLKPSAFGCLVLINALHNYIWEMRQRHDSPSWSPVEAEAMHAHMEPALKAWQAAWASNPHHSVERPNPFGLGPLSADSIPLLDLAYVRLFVNLGRSKECFWQRDFEGMAEELARGSEVMQHADHSPSSGSLGSDATDSHNSAMSLTSSPGSPTSSNLNSIRTPTPSHALSAVSNDHIHSSGQISKRERHLRKAAFYAADSLSMSDKLGVTFNSRELPLQCALCAFECAQILSEWVATVQERVGRYLGILGRDPIDYEAVPGIMLLESEDCKLLGKIAEVLDCAGVKMNYEMGGMGGIQNLGDWGYGGKILRVTASMLDKASVWPVIRIAGQALRVQADHMESRAKNSVPSKG